MKKLMFCVMALAAGAACAGAKNEGYPSLMRYFCKGLDGIEKADDGSTKLKTYDFDENAPETFAEAVDEMYWSKAYPVIDALEVAADVDLAYKFDMSLKVVENSKKQQPKATDFIGLPPENVNYFASAKKVIKGSVWTKARPSVLATAFLESLLGTNGIEIAKVPLRLFSLGGLVTEVRGVGLYDATRKTYLTPSLFGMTGSAMGKDAKEAFGGFLTVFGADLQKLAENGTKFVKFDDNGQAEANYDPLVKDLYDYLGEDVGLAIGLGVGKNNVGKKGAASYIKNLQGTCFYLSTKSGILFAGENFDSNLISDPLTTLLTKGPFGVFYNAYTGTPYPIPLDITIGNGTWKLAANAGSIKKFASLTTQAEKQNYFVEKTGLPKPRVGSKKTLDMLKMILDVALLGDSAANAKAYFEGRQAELKKFSDYAAKQSGGDWKDLAEEAETVSAFYDVVIGYCKSATELGVADTSADPGSLNITKLSIGGSKPAQTDENADQARQLVDQLRESELPALKDYISGNCLEDAQKCLEGIKEIYETVRGYLEKSKDRDGLRKELDFDNLGAEITTFEGELQKALAEKHLAIFESDYNQAVEYYNLAQRGEYRAIECYNEGDTSGVSENLNAAFQNLDSASVFLVQAGKGLSTAADAASSKAISGDAKKELDDRIATCQAKVKSLTGDISNLSAEVERLSGELEK